MFSISNINNNYPILIVDLWQCVVVENGTIFRIFLNYFFLAFFSAFLSALSCFSWWCRSSLSRRFMRRRSSPGKPRALRSAEVSANSSVPSIPRAANDPANRSNPSPSPLTHCHTWRTLTSIFHFRRRLQKVR